MISTGTDGPASWTVRPLVVQHLPDAADRGAGDDDVAGVQRPVLDQQGRDRAAALIQPCFDDGALGEPVGVGFQFLHLGDQQDVFQQVVDPLAGQGRDGDADDIAAPFFRDEAVFGQLLLDPVGVGVGFIHLVDGDDDLDVRRFGVVDRLDRLGHDAVVGRDDQDGDVGDGGAAGAHRGEGLMAGGIEEGDRGAVYNDLVGADRLGDAARLAGGDIGVADLVEDRGLAVVDVAHDDDDRAAGLQVLFLVGLVVDQLFLDGDDDFLFDLRAHLHCDEGGGVKVDQLVLGGHDPHHHQLLDDFRDGRLQPGSQFRDGDLVGDQDLQLLLAGPLEGQPLELLGLGLPFAAELLLLLLLGFLFDLLLFLLAVAPPYGPTGGRCPRNARCSGRG